MQQVATFNGIVLPTCLVTSFDEKSAIHFIPFKYEMPKILAFYLQFKLKRSIQNLISFQNREKSF